jgi:hypothetical protein
MPDTRMKINMQLTPAQATAFIADVAADTLLGQLGTMAKRLEWALWIAVIDPPRFANRN